jgi:pSer/pThr/pTyr-binding forkhead associated (FHA) protein
MILTVISPGQERRQVRVDRSPFRIGRLVDRELSLRDSRISRNHAQLLQEDGEHYIEDCDSRHGVFVN